MIVTVIAIMVSDVDSCTDGDSASNDVNKDD